MDNGYTRVGALFQTASVSNAVAAIVPPTNNLYGIIIRTCTLVINSPSASAAIGSLVADTAAPAGAGVGRVIAFLVAPIGGNVAQVVPYQIFVPPGLGLWWAANAGATGSQNSVVLTYDFVQPN